MTISEFVAKTDSFFRPGIQFFNPKFSIWLYSNARKLFLEQLTMENNFKVKIDEKYKLKLWDLEFQSPLFNAAGMFKDGKGYYTVANQGAGAFLAGTVTINSREGNKKYGIKHPFAPYSHSYTASNWMGLPNHGVYSLASQLSKYSKIKGCPIGASISSSPDLPSIKALNSIIESLKILEKANVDFIELNESCPNVEHSECEYDNGIDRNLINRLEFINNNFIKISKRRIPIILKFSNDTDINQVENLIKIAVDNQFDGINFGNTSTNYEYINHFIHTNDWNLYKFFIMNFGGGVSGLPLKKLSLNLVKTANSILNKFVLKKEFNIIRTGGIFDLKDLEDSKSHNININQWFTGYFEYFSKFGHNLYSKLFNYC